MAKEKKTRIVTVKCHVCNKEFGLRLFRKQTLPATYNSNCLWCKNKITYTLD